MVRRETENEADLRVLEARAARKQDAETLEGRLEEFEVMATVVGTQLVDVERDLMAQVKRRSEAEEALRARTARFLRALRPPWAHLMHYFGVETGLYGEDPEQAMRQIVQAAN